MNGVRQAADRLIIMAGLVPDIHAFATAGI
jgi:hypothetical protein